MADEFSGTGAGGTGQAGTGSMDRDGTGSMVPAGTTDDGVREGLQGRAHQLQQTARESGRDLLDQAVEKKDELKARAGTAVDDGRHRVSERAGSIARALHSTAQNLEMEGDAQLSHWVHQAADQVDRVVGYLNGRDAGGLMHDVEDMARRNPALFLGGTYAAGLVLGRFLRASAPERRMERETDRADEPRHDEPTREGAADSPWTGAGVSGESFSAGHASGSRTEESLREGESLGTGYGAGGAVDGSRSTGTTDDGRPGAYGAAPRGSVPLSGSADAAGFTDEDLRAAWHDGEVRPPDEGMRSASRSPADGHDPETGELTRYTDGDGDRTREG